MARTSFLKRAVTLYLVLVLVFSAHVITKVSAANEQSEWHKTYTIYINAFQTKNYREIENRGENIGGDFTRYHRDGSELRYALHDFNNNGTPELIIGGEDGTVYDIYSYNNGSVIMDFCCMMQQIDRSLSIHSASFTTGSSINSGTIWYEDTWKYDRNDTANIVYSSEIEYEQNTKHVLSESGTNPNEPDAVLIWKSLSEFSKEGSSVQPDTPSDWAVDEINAAISAALVPENLQKNYQSSLPRGSVAQMFINLIEKSTGQSIEDFMETKGVQINNNAFTDTNDKAVLAANALGIINGVGNGKFEPDGTLTRAH